MIAAIWASVAGSSDRSTGDYLKEWPEEFHEARIVNLAHRSLRAVPPTIPEGCFLQLLQLDLSHNHLQEFPEAVLNIPALEQLNVESNCLRSIPETLPDCKSLMSLFCGFNFIREIPCCLSSPESMPRLCAVFIQENYIDIGKIPKANRNVFHGVEHQRVVAADGQFFFLQLSSLPYQPFPARHSCSIVMPPLPPQVLIQFSSAATKPSKRVF